MACPYGHDEGNLLEYEGKVEERATTNGSTEDDQNQKPTDDVDRVVLHTPCHGVNLLFKDMSLKPEILKGIFDAGFEHPSQVQAKCIPKAMSGVDILCQANPRMGKTAVFVISTLQMIDSQTLAQPTVLALAPTRELASQIEADYRRLSQYFSGIRISLFCDGNPLLADMRKLRSGPIHIVVGTAGRLKTLIRERVLNLSHIKHFIVDECDKMLGQLDIQSDVHEIFLETPFEKQVMMFGPTFQTAVLQDCRKYLSKEAFEMLVVEPVHLGTVEIQNQESVDALDRVVLHTPYHLSGFEGRELLIMCAGGEDTGIKLCTVECFRPFKSEWGYLMSLPVALSKAGIVGCDKLVYLCGGEFANGAASDGVLCYDAMNNQWLTKAHMLSGRHSFGTATLIDYVFVAGGRNGASVLKTVERYDAVSDTWEFVASLPAPLTGCSMLAVKGRLYLFGGMSVFGGALSDKVYQYDIDADKWSSVKSMPLCRSGAVACVGPDGLIYVVGGISRDMEVLCRVDAYDPFADKWLPKDSMRVPRYLPGIGVFEGRMYVFGGEKSLNCHDSSIEAYDFVADEWSLLNTMLPSARSGQSCVAVAVNSVFVRSSFRMDLVHGRIGCNSTTFFNAGR
ncbi:kelch-like ECH-associated protein 1A [Paramacrobiotus metropolitanus]|uniref:kelch-like ECH-associated protein 1A n=1 Tax=Paramacrobiotus metropolitanus TaxID=2943436 RepID=UPI002445EDF2|nr:kelch-like ECH-associated protein 1A [Paramacrobiotus metropolitanus]